MADRSFRISPQAPGGPNKHPGWLIGCPRLVWRGNLQGFGRVDYIFRSAWCSFYSILYFFQLKKTVIIFFECDPPTQFHFWARFWSPHIFSGYRKNTKIRKKVAVQLRCTESSLIVHRCWYDIASLYLVSGDYIGTKPVTYDAGNYTGRLCVC